MRIYFVSGRNIQTSMSLLKRYLIHRSEPRRHVNTRKPRLALQDRTKRGPARRIRRSWKLRESPKNLKSLSPDKLFCFSSELCIAMPGFEHPSSKVTWLSARPGQMKKPPLARRLLPLSVASRETTTKSTIFVSSQPLA